MKTPEEIAIKALADGLRDWESFENQKMGNMLPASHFQIIRIAQAILAERNGTEREDLGRISVHKSSRNEIHVMPNCDIKSHEDSVFCWCQPKRDLKESNVVVHNSFSEAYGEERNLE